VANIKATLLTLVNEKNNAAPQAPLRRAGSTDILNSSNNSSAANKDGSKGGGDNKAQQDQANEAGVGTQVNKLKFIGVNDKEDEGNNKGVGVITANAEDKNNKAEKDSKHTGVKVKATL
jgi:hypothetical protein